MLVWRLITSAPIFEVITIIALRKSTLRPPRIREMALFHNLEQHIVGFGMGFFNLIEDND